MRCVSAPAACHLSWYVPVDSARRIVRVSLLPSALIADVKPAIAIGRWLAIPGIEVIDNVAPVKLATTLSLKFKTIRPGLATVALAAGEDDTSLVWACALPTNARAARKGAVKARRNLDMRNLR